MPCGGSKGFNHPWNPELSKQLWVSALSASNLVTYMMKFAVLLLALFLLSCVGSEGESPSEHTLDGVLRTDALGNPIEDGVTYYGCPRGGWVKDLRDCPKAPYLETCRPEEIEQVTDEQIEEFLLWFSRDVVRWASAPTVRLSRDLPGHVRRAIMEAISRLNTVLPDPYDMRIGRDATDPAERVPQGEIHVHFGYTPQWTWPDGSFIDPERTGLFGIAGYNSDEDGLIHSRIWIGANAEQSPCPGRQDDELLRKVALHELLHALGFPGHVPWPRYDTIMDSQISCNLMDSFEEATLPMPLDCAALRKIYSLEIGTPIEDIAD